MAVSVSPHRAAHGEGKMCAFPAPTAPGNYRLYVRPVIEGLEWLENVGAYVDVSVR